MSSSISKKGLGRGLSSLMGDTKMSQFKMKLQIKKQKFLFQI